MTIQYMPCDMTREQEILYYRAELDSQLDTHIRDVTVELYPESCRLKSIQYFKLASDKDPVLHRTDGYPAYAEWYEDRSKLYERHLVDGLLHKDDGPAVRGWGREDILAQEEYYIQGKLHRDHLDGPALMWWDEKGEKIRESYHMHQCYHRDPRKGPAYIAWDKGNIIKKFYHWNDNLVDKSFIPEEFLPDGLGRVFL